MARLSRRTFLGWLGTLGALIGVRRAPAAVPAHLTAQPRSLPRPALLALAAAILPSELGTEGLARATREFSRWVDEYRGGAELLHPYGSETISYATPLPLVAWRAQLTALDAAARHTHGAGWLSLGVPPRQALVRQALTGQTLRDMPAPQQASHIAVALLSHFYGSADATDLCYRAQIGKNQCRPLVHASRQPLPLSNGGHN